MKKIAKTVFGALIAIGIAAAMLTVGCSAAVIPSDEGFVIAGDANSDEIVNIKDFVRIKLYLAERTSDISIIAADYNMSGDIETEDVVAMRKVLLGMDASADWSEGIY